MIIQLKSLKKIFAVDGEGTVNNEMCQKWFVTFIAGNLLNDFP